MMLQSPWPPVPGSFVLGSMKSPVAVAIVGRARFALSPEHYCMMGHLRSANLGIEKVIANIVSNPRIRFLIVCGREEGHLPGDAIVSLANNGINEDTSIVGTRAQLPFLSDITREAIARFREQVKVIDLMNPKESDGSIDWQDPPFDFDAGRLKELEDVISECERTDPGTHPGGPMIVALPRPFHSKKDIGMVLKDQVDRISSLMLRMPSEKLNTDSDLVTISSEFEIIMDPVDGAVMGVPSIAFYKRMRAYLMGK